MCSCHSYCHEYNCLLKEKQPHKDNQGWIQKFLVEEMVGVWGHSPQRGSGAEF